MMASAAVMSRMPTPKVSRASHGEGGEVPLVKEGQGAHGRQDHLERRAPENLEEAWEDEREDVAGLVNDEVDAVSEAERTARRVEAELSLEDLPAEDRHDEQAQGPPGYGGPGDQRTLSLRPWRRVRRSSRDGRLRRWRRPPPRRRDESTDRGWSDARHRPGTSDRASASLRGSACR